MGFLIPVSLSSCRVRFFSLLNAYGNFSSSDVCGGEPLQTFQMHGVCFFQHRDFFYSILFCDLYKICYIILNFSQIRYSEHMLAFVSAELSFEDPQP